MRTAISLTVLLVLAGAASAQDDPPAAAGQEKTAPLEAEVTKVKGVVDVKRPDDKDWVAAETGMKLRKGSEICTAVASKATLKFGGNITVEVKALTQIKVEELLSKGKGVNADVNLKFGTLEVDIQKGDLRADMKVAAPQSTTSVSGSHGIVWAPASSEMGGYLTIQTTSGEWDHELENGLVVKIFGRGGRNNRGDLRRDMTYRYRTLKYLFLFGQPPPELYQDESGVKAGDPNPGSRPLHEWAQKSPFSPKFKKPAALPRPPPPPTQP